MKTSGTIAFIPVRGGSKSIPGKNIKLLAGKPLVYWTAKAASDCSRIDEVFVATDDDHIAAVVRELRIPKVKVIGRSPETATDTASTESALLEFADTVSAEIIVLIQATSPLLQSADIEAGLSKFNHAGCDSLLSTVRQKRFIWKSDSNGLVVAENYEPAKRPRRQDFEGYLVENGAYYVMKREGLLESRNRLHGRIATHEMDESTFIEIDEPSDWLVVEAQLMKRTSRQRIPLLQCLKGIKLVISDVDGVLTDAGMYYSEMGDELKKFNTRDGKGFELLRNVNIQTGIITSENTQLVARRAKKLQVSHLYQGYSDKRPALDKILSDTGFTLSEVAYIGDDLADIPILEKVGIACCPADAIVEVAGICDYVCSAKGGAGVFRELAEVILKSRAQTCN